MPEIKDAPAVKSGEVRGYTDDPCARYVEGLKTITKADALRRFLKKWPFLAADAIAQAKGLTDADVLDMQTNRKAEGEEAVRVVERYGCILLPGRMISLSMISERFKAPAGCVYIRLWETGEHDKAMLL